MEARGPLSRSLPASAVLSAPASPSRPATSVIILLSSGTPGSNAGVRAGTAGPLFGRCEPAGGFHDPGAG